MFFTLCLRTFVLQRAITTGSGTHFLLFLETQLEKRLRDDDTDLHSGALTNCFNPLLTNNDIQCEARATKSALKRTLTFGNSDKSMPSHFAK